MKLKYCDNNAHGYNTARSTIFFYDNASPTGMRDRSKVKKTVPAQVPLGTILREILSPCG